MGEVTTSSVVKEFKYTNVNKVYVKTGDKKEKQVFQITRKVTPSVHFHHRRV